VTGKLTARRIILEQTGKMKPSIANGVDALAEAIRMSSSFDQVPDARTSPLVRRLVAIAR
jgi:hypothetical protein